jgi:hypothetical protein
LSWQKDDALDSLVLSLVVTFVVIPVEFFILRLWSQYSTRFCCEQDRRRYIVSHGDDDYDDDCDSEYGHSAQDKQRRSVSEEETEEEVDMPNIKVANTADVNGENHEVQLADDEGTFLPECCAY